MHHLHATQATIRNGIVLYRLYVARLTQWSDINAFYSAASLKCHGDSAAVVLSTDATQTRYNPDKPRTERTFLPLYSGGVATYNHGSSLSSAEQASRAYGRG